MTLLTRLGRLLRADLHTVIDGLEEPAAALREALRDMRHALARGADEEARLVREAERLAQALEVARTQAVRAAEDLTLCLDADAGDVARTAMRRRLEADARVA
ncbi:MAG: PspA/IM30 family protein, partial [Gammaproteobacteria bacterium]